MDTPAFDWCDAHPRFEVQEAEYVRLLGFPRHYVLEGRPRELADWARQWFAEQGRPWTFARTANRVELGAHGISIAGTAFASARLLTAFSQAQAEAAGLIAVSAGPECEQFARRCWEEEKPDEYFFLEMFGSAVVETLMTQAAGRLCAWAEQHGLVALPRYSPGYAGWSISDQAELRRVLQDGHPSSVPGELEVLPSGMLRPKKSLLSLFGLTRHREKVPPGSHLVPCTNCSLPGCQYRRSAYRHGLTEPMDGLEQASRL